MMSTKKSFSYRVDEKIKDDFEKVCTKYGLTPSNAIAMYVTYIARTNEIPTILLAPDSAGRGEK